MDTRNRTLSALLTIAVLMAAGVATAETRVDETRALAADGYLEISNVAGSLTIVGWDRDEVKISGTLEDDVEELEIEEEGRGLSITVRVPRRIRPSDEVEAVLEVRIPRGCRLEAGTVSADVSLEDFEGEAEIGTVSGMINVRKGPSTMEISTVSGPVEIRSETRDLSVETVSGSVVLARSRGDLELATISGSIELADAELDNFSFGSISGGLELTGALPDRARWSLESHSAEIVLKLPADTSADFDVATFNGDVRNGFGPKARRTGKYSPGRRLEFTAGSGDAEVEIDTFSGDVVLVKK